MLQRLRNINLLDVLVEQMGKRSFWLASGGIFLILFSLLVYGLWRMQQAPPQPIQFNHQVHVQLGVQCLYCHPGAWTQASAGLPTTAKCWGCHQQMANTKPEQQKLVAYAEKNQSIPWVPVFIQPDFVYFNHRPHIAAGLNCETCHGEISRMSVPPKPIPRQNMGWCLNCHRQHAGDDQEKLMRLIDCATCHR
ncbi:MAG: cytochrome c family protein [Anaerolineales bacterium]|nr:cytochrome c family protein [Anaerolineales bacterium]